jgi:hypothetical protein
MLTIVLVVAAGVCLVLYLARRRARLNKQQ